MIRPSNFRAPMQSRSGEIPNRGEGFEMRRKLSRRAFAAGAVATASFRFAPAVAQAAPFRIGLLTVKTGPLAQGGIQMEQGIASFLKEGGNMLAHRKVEFISADTGGNPA